MDECITERWDYAMTLVGIIDEDFVNYKKPSMVLEFPYCSFKCDKACGMQVCQNSALATAPKIDIDIQQIIKRYKQNKITKAICCQGLEPLDSAEELYEFIKEFRKISNDDVVIYTGYNREDCIAWRYLMRQFKNIIMKYGLFIPGQQPHYDEVLGVNLASDNQYGEKVS